MEQDPEAILDELVSYQEEDVADLDGEALSLMRSSFASEVKVSFKEAEENLDELSVFSHSRHVFILSWAAKPIFSRHGDENALASFMGVISAIISNMQTLFDGEQDQIRYIKAGQHKFAFLVKGALYFVAVSDRKEDSIHQMIKELEYVHLQIVSILTSNVIKVIESHPTYDLRKLIGSTENLLHALIQDFEVSPSYLFEAVSPMKVPIAVRQKIGSIMKIGVGEARDGKKNPKVLFAALISGNQLVQLIHAKTKTIHNVDILLLINFVSNLTSLRSSESWTPICLPYYDQRGFLYAHVCFVVGDLVLVLLTADSSAFYLLQKAKNSITENLSAQNVLQYIQEEQESVKLSIHQMRLGCPELLHFIFKSEKRSQFIQPLFDSPYASVESQKRLFELYKSVHYRTGSNVIYFELLEYETILCLVSPDDYKLIAVFTPTVLQKSAFEAAHKAVAWIQKNESSLFVTTWPKSG